MIYDSAPTSSRRAHVERHFGLRAENALHDIQRIGIVKTSRGAAPRRSPESWGGANVPRNRGPRVAPFYYRSRAILTSTSQKTPTYAFFHSAYPPPPLLTTELFLVNRKKFFFFFFSNSTNQVVLIPYALYHHRY